MKKVLFHIAQVFESLEELFGDHWLFIVLHC